MQVHLHAGARQFLASAGPFLKSDPFSANVIAVVACRIAAGDEPATDRHVWASVEDSDGQVVGVAMHTPPHHLFVSRMRKEAAVSLAHVLADAGQDLPGVNGAVDASGAFAETWTGRTGRLSEVVTTMRMYRLGDLAWPRGVPGVAVIARDIDLVAEWLVAFHDEAQPHAPVVDWHAVAEQRVAAGQVHLWRTGGAFMALAAVSAAAAGVARVGPVYTPPPYRRQGYGAAVTANATAAALSAGAQHVILYSDVANPTSNSIYQNIGYRPDHEAEERAFR